VQAFFRGTVILLYLISHYFAEQIFIVACFLPMLYSIVISFLLRFGGCGRMITAKNRAKRLARKGVISGEKRDRFCRKCLKGTAPDVRAAFALFSEGRIGVEELTLAFSRSVRVRGDLFKGGLTYVGVLSSLSVFLSFFFGAPIGETLLRTAICAFLTALNGVALHFALYAFVVSAEKAAERLARILDDRLLRERREESPEAHPFMQPIEKEDLSDERTLLDLRALLKDIDPGRRR